MTVAVAHTVLRYRPTFGNVNQIHARDTLRLASVLQELTGLRMYELRLYSRAHIEEELVRLGREPAAILAHWQEGL